MSAERRADTGRAAVYAAELAAFDGTSFEVIRPLSDLVELAAAVTSSAWWPHGPTPVVAARADAASSSARRRGAGPAVVRLAAGQMTSITLLHELAHVLAGVEAGHGPRFRRAYLDVVAYALGPVPAGWLQEQFDLGRLAVAGRRGWPAPSGGLGGGLGRVFAL